MKDPIRKTYKNREEWLADREGSLGASEIASLFGMGFESPLQVWVRHALGRKDEPPQDLSRRMELGLACEPLLAKWTADELGRQVRTYDPPVRWERPEIPRTHATPDGEVMDASGNAPEAVLELKTWHSDADWPADGTPHPYVLIQVQHQMLMTGLTRAYVGVMFGLHHSFRVIQVDFHEAFGRKIIEKVKEFWQMVDAGAAPRSTGHLGDKEALKLLYPKATGAVITLESGQWGPLLRRYQKYQKVAKDITKLTDALSTRVKEEMKDAEVALVEGEDSAFAWKNVKSVIPPKPAKVLEYRMFKIIKRPKES